MKTEERLQVQARKFSQLKPGQGFFNSPDRKEIFHKLPLKAVAGGTCECGSIFWEAENITDSPFFTHFCDDKTVYVTWFAK